MLPARQLDFKFLSGSIGANLMPIVPPDPISATVVVEVSNLTSENVSEVAMPWANVFEVGSPNRLGRIEFSTSWDGHLAPSEKDTVTVNKISSGTKLFDPPCGQDVFLQITAERSGEEVSVFDTDTLTFGCVF